MAAQAPSEPNETIYVHNLNEKIKKNVLKKSLHSVFSQFGKILDIVALRGLKSKGQAWVIFENKNASTNALRQMQGFPFYDKPMKIEFARATSDIVSKRKGTFVTRDKSSKTKISKQPTALQQNSAPPKSMESAPPQTATHSHSQNNQNPPSNILFASNLSPDISESMLNVIFQQYRGFAEVRMVPGKQGIAFIEFNDEMQATVALQGLHGFKLAPNAVLNLSYAKR